jgi:hypothetical protein
LGGKGRRVMAQGQPSQKVRETLSQKISWVWFLPIIPAMWEAEVGGWWSEASPKPNHEALSKEKRIRGVAKVVESLSNKCKALSSNFSTILSKKKKQTQSGRDIFKSFLP